MVGERPTTKCIQSAGQIKKSRKIASPQIKAHIFQDLPKFPKWNGMIHLIFQPEFLWFFHVNGKNPQNLNLSKKINGPLLAG